jgi:hypothetical protein
MFEVLDDDNFMLYAMRAYQNPHCIDILEFNEDLNRIRCVKRLFKQYEKNGILKSRYIINHLVILYNVFEREPCTRLLVLKLDEYLPILKPFLLYLGYWQDEFVGIGEKTRIIRDSDVVMDQGVIDSLRDFEKERNRNGAD